MQRPVRHSAPLCAGAVKPRRREARAFTIVELAVVVLVILVLAGILMVALRGVMGSARQATTERFVSSIVPAVEQFKNDLTYYPPLLSIEDVPLGEDPPVAATRPQVTVPEALAQARMPGNANEVRRRLQMTRYGSEYTLAAYLMGIGDLDGADESGALSPPSNPGASTDYDDGHKGPGFRSPGPDRSWGGGADRTVQRPAGAGGGKATATRTGRVYGPYLDPGASEKFLQLDVSGRTGMWKLVDPWGQPLRYYINWPTKAPGAGGAPETSVALTPVELRSKEAVEAQIDGEDYLELDRLVFSAPFMILSAGEPRIKDSEGKAAARFGDRDTDGSLVQPDLSVPFDPASLTDEVRRDMLRDLGAAVRGTP